MYVGSNSPPGVGLVQIFSVRAESLFGEGSIFDDLASALPSELLPVRLGIRVKSMLPSLSTPFVFAPASDEEVL